MIKSNIILICKINIGLARNFFYKNNLIEAEKYTLEGIKNSSERKDTIGQIINYNTLASIYIKRQNYSEAKEYYLKAFSLIKNSKSDRKNKILEALYGNLAWVQYNLKEYQAYESLAKGNAIRDSLRNLEFDGIINEIEAKHNVDIVKQNAEKKHWIEVQQREKFQYWSIFLGFMLVGVSTTFYIFRSRSKLKQENIQLQLTQTHLLQEKKLEKIHSQTSIKILNATLDGKESERKLIAETLHDSVSALLSAANLHLQAFKSDLKEDAPEEIIKSQKIIEEASIKIRNLSHQLISSVLLKFGLSFAIHDFCEKYSNSKLEITASTKNIKRYDQNFEIKINNIIEELVNNIIKHSHASQASVSVLEFRKKLHINIQDDGRGFDTNSKSRSTGIGINQIEARIKMLEGDFILTSKIAEGTKIEIRVPVVYKS